MTLVTIRESTVNMTENTAITVIYPSQYLSDMKTLLFINKLIMILTTDSSVSGAAARSRASIYLVHKAPTQGQFRTARAYTLLNTDATYNQHNTLIMRNIKQHNKLEQTITSLRLYLTIQACSHYVH